MSYFSVVKPMTVGYGILLGLFWMSCGQEEHVSFNEDVRPILNEHCLACHGGVRASGGFSLLFEDDAYAATESGKTPIVPGNHEASELYRRLIAEDPEMRMPHEKEALSSQEINLIAQWIDQGAHWETHWAYQRPSIDGVPMSSTNWSDHPVDRFIEEELTQHGLAPNAPAEADRLARRISFDLIGLPPSLTEVQQISQNPDQELAINDLVDDLLTSPHFGEKWASMWLDLARYADTKGFEKDSNRSIWMYRDWVIRAFNEDVPFDQFTIEQLAGDLLPNPTEDQLIATAYHRNSIANDEGGTNDEEFRIASTIERVGNTYEVWMGTTMACVQCHSHPYDPLRHEDFYTSMAYFNNLADRDIYHEDPRLYVYDTIQEGKVEDLLRWLNQDPDLMLGSLYDKRQQTLGQWDYRMLEAENYYLSSPLIELIRPDLDLLWQVQDSSWVMYRAVDLTEVETVKFRAAAWFDRAGEISIHLDSVGGREIGRATITRTGDWQGAPYTRPGQGHLKWFETPVENVEGKHDIFLQFWVGERYHQHLFYLDKIFLETDHFASNTSQKHKRYLDNLYDLPAIATPILEELPEGEQRETRLFNRGSWLDPRQQVASAIPGFFKTEENIDNRLDFAKWLVSDENTLTARVIVNRVWAQLFGQGLVRSLEEFGSQGFKPSHRELLDYLAIKFAGDWGWSIKRLIREIITSRSYQQSSNAGPDKLEVDPSNELISRGPRARLSGEEIRDQILCLSGLLDSTVGGAPIILPELDISPADTPSWATVHKGERFRRSIYTFWKRTNPFPDMITFDSPDRTICESQRISTNTPLQALTLLNDETYIKAAENLAKGWKDEDEPIEELLTSFYRQVTLAEPTSEEVDALHQLYLEARSSIEQDEAHEKALAVVANVLLNLDKMIVKS